MRFWKWLAAATCGLLAVSACAQTVQSLDITRQPILYVVPYAHLDTQWRWDFQQSISEYLLKTMRVNFAYIDKYPHYVFNWTGANRYRLMKEYYPDDFARMKQYISQGRWFPAGSSVEEGDVNLPSAESIFRQILYGNDYFRTEFGKASNEYMLPDCFGFPASLPTILHAAGIKGFSTQKLSANWQPAPLVGGPGSPEATSEGIPFNVGLWKGPDGSSVIAALNPGRYGSRIRYDLSKTPPPLVLPGNLTASQTARAELDYQDWPARIELDGKVTGVYADYHYIGIGDNGGASDEETVKMLEAIVTGSKINLPADAGQPTPPADPVRVGDGPVRVISSAADQMFNDIKPDMTARMPVYQGDLELINHSAGSLTSQAYHKRWNRENEILAGAAETASVAADWMGGREYPQKRLNDAWMLVLAGQFHDVAAGTATPRAYQLTWNDDVIAMNQFAGVLKSATQAIASALDTQAGGIPVIVYNSLNIARQDVVEARIPLAGGTAGGARVVGPDGREVPSQREGDEVLFLADVPSMGYAVYDVQPAPRSHRTSQNSPLKVTPSSIENARYRISLNAQGDIASIFDKSIGKELLSASIRLAISNDAPRQYPAWNMDFDQEQAAPRAYVSGPAKIRIVEQGPVRVALEVSRETEGSRFVQTVSLAAGEAGERIQFHDSVDWRTLSANLKAVFPLAPSNPDATYNWEVGTVKRATAQPRQFEVGSHYWIDLTDKGGAYGATILTDVKNASDKRDDRTIRLTLLRTPGLPTGKVGKSNRSSYSDQLNQDWGHHEITYGLCGHKGDWRQAESEWQAYRLSTPLLAFTTTSHPGPLGRTFSLMSVDNPRIRVLALKKAENSDEIVVRLVEQDGEAAPHARIRFASPIAAAREVNGQEQPIGPATVDDGSLEMSFAPYEPRSFALRLIPPPAMIRPVQSQPVALHYDLAAASKDDARSAQGFDGNGDALPAGMLPAELRLNGVDFHLEGAAGAPDAVISAGQSIALPRGNFNRVYLLASGLGDQTGTFLIDKKGTALTIQNWGGFIGQWDTRLWKPEPDSVMERGRQVPLRKDWAVSAHHAAWPDLEYRGSPTWAPRYPDDYLGLEPGYIKRADLAWYCDHYHTPQGLNVPYAYSYLFAYSIDLPPHATSLTLPNNGRIRILAISVAHQEPEVLPAQPLYDSLSIRDERPGDYVTTMH